MSRLEDMGENAIHLCVDMQRMFADETPWATPWMSKVAPVVARLIRAHPDRCLFTRFIPARSVSSAHGVWKAYYQKWSQMTLDRLTPDWLDLVAELRREAPQAPVFDKITYSPWVDGKLEKRLRNLNVDTVIVSGAETEVCVAATVLGALDRGFRVVVATDAICSSSDQTHDAMVDIYHQRFSIHVAPVKTRTILGHWH